MKKKVVSALATAAIISSAYAQTAFANTYTIQKGDSLSIIATKYHTSVLELKKLNNLSSDRIRLGAVLKVPDSVSKPAPTKAQATSKVYTVVKGDTLGKIAKQFSISLTDLKLWNNLKSHTIYPAQKLKVSAGVVPVVSKPASKPTVQPSSGNTVKPNSEVPIQTGSQPTDLSGASEYIVKSGDTLGKIAIQYRMSVSDLKKRNNLSSDLIFVGQALKVTTTTSVVEASAIIQEATKLIGIPYIWGGSTEQGFDCSGFVYYIHNKAGISINRYSTDGYYNRSYYVDMPKAGDLVFFENTYKAGISHMGIYLGDNQFIHADETRGVTITSLSNAYYQEHLDGFKRFY